MEKRLLQLILLLLFLSYGALAQQRDSVRFNLPTHPQDTLQQKSIHKADSITNSFQAKADSLNTVYQNQFTKIDAQRSHVQYKIDSLNNLKLPTEKLTYTLDSLAQLKSAKFSLLTKEVDDLKVQATNSFKEITLPSQMQEPFDKLKSSVQAYSIPALHLDTPGLPTGDFSPLTNLKIPSLSNRLKVDTNLKGMGNLNQITEFTDNAGEYAKDAQNVMKGNLNEVKGIDKALERKVGSMEGVDQLTKGEGMLGQANQFTDSTAMQNKMKELVKEQIMSAAQDHFVGKQEVLKQAMEKMSKLKGKYSDVKSMAELPKKLPNPLKGKPFIERLVPGVTFQIQTANYFLLDVNALILYRITPRLSVGAGWNQRLPFDKLEVKKEGRVYGPRAAIELKWTKGINFRFLPEIMNTMIPPALALRQGIDPAYREWVPSAFVGIKKDFTVYKKIKGNTEVLYNLYDPKYYSPYGNRLALRFGFELAIKKKPRAKK
jgi:hypothetical protein